jgi:hypothetical protein
MTWQPDETVCVYAIHPPAQDRLAGVIAEMQILGAPIIEVVDCGDHYQALEGSHRLAAAAALGLVPILTIHQPSTMIDITRFDWYQAGPENWAGTEYSASDIVGELFSPPIAVPYDFTVTARDPD